MFSPALASSTFALAAAFRSAVVRRASARLQDTQNLVKGMVKKARMAVPSFRGGNGDVRLGFRYEAARVISEAR